MKAIWVEQGDSIPFGLYRSLGISHIYLDIQPWWDTVNRAAEVRWQGFTLGLYWGHWPSLPEQAAGPATLAKHCSDLISGYEKEWRAKKLPVQCEFQVDLEDHDSSYIENFIKEWRKVRPLKVSSWTLESWQGGEYTWMEKSLIDTINADVNLKVVPQLYNGNMDVVYDSNAVAKNLRNTRSPGELRGGIQEDRIQFFYDAVKAPVGWDGYLYTNRRI